MKKYERSKKGKIFKRADGSQIAFFQLSHDFTKHQSELKGSSVKVYIFLAQQAGIKNTLSIEAAESIISTWTGIKEKKTINLAIRELVKEGWIGNILVQLNNSNVYTINLEKQTANIKLIEWLDERAKKNSENTKGLIAIGKIVRGEKGRFQRVESKDSIQ